MQCFDAAGKLLWEEKTSRFSNSARRGMNQMEKDLGHHIGKPGLLFKDAEEPPRTK